MEVGAQVWLKDGAEWVLATVAKKTVDEVEVVADGSSQRTVISIGDDTDELDTIKLCNNALSERADNLINLPHLHEPALLHCLQQRYHDGDIYTYTGPILIAVNPFKHLSIYGTDELSNYYNSGLLKSQGIESASTLPPHVFAIADAAYHGMVAALSADSGGPAAAPASNQSILISGESGAGKTESTKIVLRYLTTVGNGSTGLSISTGSVMEQILQSNPILEAFGNAATLRNDNSSRFGKFIQLSFNRRGHLIGGSIETYLLEKVRLPFQQTGQRNFHIFYQMAAGGSVEEKREWGLPDIRDVQYANQGQTFHLRHVDDGEEYRLLQKALGTLRFSADTQRELFELMAAILHLGQIEFGPDSDGEGSEVVQTGPGAQSVHLAAKLMGVSAKFLVKCVTVRSILAMNEVIEKRLKASQASDARDALARHLYGKVFSWVVEAVNASIGTDESHDFRAKIGVLDIFGFECFDRNSFEQLCINYTNEALQQQFNHFMFKTEQAEYEREKIDALLIEFSDNQDCLDLIDKKPSGVIAVLDDECRLPKGSDKNFSARLYKVNGAASSRFSATATQIRNGEFVINHFAGGVCYNTAQFVDKNKDELPKECTNLFSSSVVPLMSKIFVASRPTLKAQRSGSILMASGGVAQAAQRVTVGSQFREQLAGLLSTIHETTPHYIRCLKPNDQSSPDNFNRVRCNEQLRYGGVLEAVRVARLGFPVRLTHSEFYSRYQPVANPYSRGYRSLPRMLDDAEESPVEMCVLLLKAISDGSLPEGAAGLSFNSTAKDFEKAVSSARLSQKDASRLVTFFNWHGSRSFKDESVQLGLTKVFFRKHAHDILEGRRSRRLVQAAVTVQSSVRRYMRQSMFLDMKKAALLIQRVGRGTISRVKTHLFRINKAATRIQAIFRSYLAYFEYNRYVMAVVVIQSSFRARMSRRSTFNYWFADKIVRLQHSMKQLMYRHRFLRYRRAVVYLQAAYRRRCTRGLLKTLRANSRDLGKLQQSNDALKAEIRLIRKQASAESTRAEAIRYAQHEIEASKAKDAEIEFLNTEIVFLKAELQEEQNTRVNVEAQLSKAIKAASVERKRFKEHIRGLQDQLDAGIGRAAVDQLKVDLEMALEDLSRETAVRRSLEKEIERLTAGATGDRMRSRTESDGMSPMHRSSPRTTGKSAIPRYIGSPASPLMGKTSHTRNAQTPNQKTTPKNTPTGANSTTKSSVLTTSQKEHIRREKELTSSTHFMRKESRTQKRKQDLFRGKLKQGVLVCIYDQTRNTRKKALLRMDIGTDELYLCYRLARYSSVPTKMTDMKPINFADVLECVPGALIERNNLKSLSPPELEAILTNQCFLTIVSHNSNSGSRNLVVLMESREERNSLLQNIRALAEEVQCKTGSNTPVPPPPPAKSHQLPAGSSMSFASPTTASRRKSLSVSTLPPEALAEFEVVDTPRTASKRHDLFEKASARKQARNTSKRKDRAIENPPPAPFVRSEDDSTLWNPELRSYEQPTRSFLKSTEVATEKLNRIYDRNEASVWRPGGVSSPYLSHKSLSARPPLLNQFEDAGEPQSAAALGQGRPPHIDTDSPDKEWSGKDSPVASSARSRLYSVSSNGSGSDSITKKSPRAPGTAYSSLTPTRARKHQGPSSKTSNSDSEESAGCYSPMSHKGSGTPLARPEGLTSSIIEVETATRPAVCPSKTPSMDPPQSPSVPPSSPSKRRPMGLRIETTAEAEPAAVQDEVVLTLPPKVPTVATPSRTARTPDGGDSTRKFSFKNFMLDEASAALSHNRGKDGSEAGPVRYTASTANIVSPGARIKVKISNPSPSLQRFLAMSNSANLVEIPKPAPSPGNAGGKSKFTFDMLENVAKEVSASDRAVELERLRNARLKREVADLNSEMSTKDIEISILKERDQDLSAALKLKETLAGGDAETRLEVGKCLEQTLIDKHELSSELRAVKEAKSEEYEEFY